MVKEQRGQGDGIALLSIRPKYARLIRDGVKRVEFRRRPFARAVTHIVFYATSPVRRLVGFCEVEDVVRDTPASLWSQHGDYGGIERETLLRYLDGLTSATAIILRPFSPIEGNWDLWSIGVRRPPQSFQYLSRGSFEALAGGLG